MSCTNKGTLCDRIVLTQSVNFSSTDNTLLINLPSGSYNNGEKYCIVIAQSIPVSATIGATVGITIGTSATVYPLVNNDCTDVTAAQMRTRTRYATRVATNISSGVFKLLSNCNCACCQQTATPAISG